MAAVSAAHWPGSAKRGAACAGSTPQARAPQHFWRWAVNDGLASKITVEISKAVTKAGDLCGGFGGIESSGGVDGGLFVGIDDDFVVSYYLHQDDDVDLLLDGH